MKFFLILLFIVLSLFYTKTIGKKKPFHILNRKHDLNFRFSEQNQNSDISEVYFVNASSNSTYSKRNSNIFKIITDLPLPENSLTNDFTPIQTLNSDLNYWCSENSYSEIIYWEGQLSVPFRILDLLIIWAYIPYQYKIQISTNGEVYNDVINWRNTTINPDLFLSLKTKPNPSKFHEKISFETPLPTLFLRILMKNPIYFYIGIYQVKIYASLSPILIRRKIIDNNYDQCIISFNVNEVLAVDCYDAIDKFDGKEIFYYRNWNFKNLNNSLCINSQLKFENCEENTKNFDFFSGNIINNKKCLDISDEYFVLDYKYINISTNSIMYDNQHNPEKILLDNQNEYWASNPGDKKVIIKLVFPEISIKKISIKWKNPTKSFSLELLSQNLWKTLINIENNEKLENSFELMYENGAALKIIMRDSDYKFNDLIYYSIIKIEIETKAKRIIMRECDITIKNNIKWFLEDINNVDSLLSEKLSKENEKISKFTDNLLSKEKILIKYKHSFLPEINLLSKQLKQKILNLSFNITNIKNHGDTYLYSNLQAQQKQYFQSYQISLIGSRLEKPALDCQTIKKLNPIKRSGYYWIKPECSLKSLRVFCDFEENLNLDYNLIKNYNPIFTPKELVEACAEKGLEPLKIISKNQILRINKFLNEQNNNDIIPFGYDYSCNNDQNCGKYSFFAPNNNILIENNLYETNNQVNNDQNYVYLGLHQSSIKLFPFKMRQTNNILCSTNNKKTIIEEEWINIDCETTPFLNKIFDINTDFANFKVKCPKNCKSLKNKPNIFGNIYYTYTSSICLSAIHNNIENQYLLITLENNKNNINFNGIYQNGIESLDFFEKCEKFFQIEEFKPNCPLQIKKNKLNFKNNMRLKETIDLSIENLENKFDDNYNIIDINLKKYFKKKINELQFFKNLISRIQKTLSFFTVLETMKDLNPFNQEISMNNYKKKYEEINLFIEKLKILSKKKLKEKIEYKNQLLLEKKKYNKFTAFLLDYEFPIDFLFEIIDFKNSKEGPSIWSYEKQSILGHNKVLSQKSNINRMIDETIASFLVLKDHFYYDFTLKIKLFMNSIGNMGIVFRFIDQFNYYIFEIGKNINGLGFKRIRKVINGISTVIKLIEDGGYLMNKWYNVSLQVQQYKITVFFGLEQEEFYSSYEVYDFDKVYGQIGLAVNNANNVFFDELEIKPLNCIDLNNRNNVQNIYVSPKCSRYKESFKIEINIMWKQVNNPFLTEWKIDIFHEKSRAIIRNRLKTTNQIEILEFIGQKYCNIGIISSKILIENEGSAGIGFKYQNLNNFYYFEIQIEDRFSFCHLYKITNGKSLKILTNDKECSKILKNQWNLINIQLTEQKIIINLSQSNLYFSEIFITNNEFSEVLESISLISKNNTLVGFTDISLNPFENLDNNSEKNNKNLEINDKKQESKTKQKIFKNCLEISTTQKREKYCKFKFTEKLERNKCENNFCNHCCEIETIQKNSIENFQCIKECNNIIEIEDRNEKLIYCSENNHSFDYCLKNLNSEQEIKKCQLDFCNLCCVKSGKKENKGIFKKDDEIKCKNNCSLKFR